MGGGIRILGKACGVGLGWREGGSLFWSSGVLEAKGKGGFVLRGCRSDRPFFLYFVFLFSFLWGEVGGVMGM